MLDQQCANVLRSELVTEQEYRLVCCPGGPADARDEHLARSDPQHYRVEALHDGRLPWTPREPTGVSARL